MSESAAGFSADAGGAKENNYGLLPVSLSDRAQREIYEVEGLN